MNPKRICIIDCGSEKRKEINRIAEDPNHIIDTWYLFYPSINFKLDVPTDSLNKMTLIQVDEDNIKTSGFNIEFTSSYDYIIFSGGGLIEEIQNDIKKFFFYLKEIRIPTLGICFGHQIIGLVYDSKVFKLKEKVSGNEQVSIIENNELLATKIINTHFIQNHIEAISLPNEFILNGTSATCENEMMSHKTKSIYGVQFHPEVSGDVGEQMIKNFINLQSK